MNIILASQSPRRIQLLKEIGLEFETVPSQFDEKDRHDTPELLALHNAEGKARVVAQSHPKSLIIAADTFGVVGDEFLNKPKDRDDAFRLIKIISGTPHEVISGVCVIDTATGKELSTTVVTKVKMMAMTDEEINHYLDTHEWHDKAAAYAIQGHGALYVESIEGDYFNVVGLPLCTLAKLLKEIGHPIT